MSLLLSMPSGISDELEQALTAIQTQLGAVGRRVDIPYQSRYWSVDSGTITPLEAGLNIFSYTVFGDHMTVFFDMTGIAVTGTPNIITITAPEGFRVRQGDRLHAATNRLYTQPCVIQTDTGDREAGEVWVTNTSGTSTIDNSANQVALHFHQLDDGVFGSGTSIGLFGHCTFECERVT